MTDTPPIQLRLETDLQALRSLPLLRALPNRPLAALQKTARIVYFGAGSAFHVKPAQSKNRAWLTLRMQRPLPVKCIEAGET